jgi:hypothetical protein
VVFYDPGSRARECSPVRSFVFSDGCAALLNMAVEPLAMCYLVRVGGTSRGRPPTPRFRTFQICPKDLRAALRQAGGAEDCARVSRRAIVHRGEAPMSKEIKAAT